MRLLLIEPPFERFQGIKRCFFPLGIASLAAYVRPKGYDILVYDAELGQETEIVPYAEAAKAYERFLQGLADPGHYIWQEVRQKIRDFAPDVVGISCATVKYEPALKIAALAKEWNPEVQVVLGGCHPTVLPQVVIKEQVVDFVVRGEGEVTMLELLECLENGRRGLEDVLGLSFKVKDKIRHNPPRPLMPNLDAIPYPARDLLDNCQAYDPEDMGLLMGSRGCPFECTYCASENMWGRRVRYRSVENILGEIKEVWQRFGTTQFSFEDDSFTSRKKLVLEFCDRLIEEKLPIKWSAITRIHLLNDELLERMRAAGCNHIRVGIESGSDKVLRATKKHLTVSQIRQGAEVLRRHKIYWSAYFMAGLPCETEEDIRATIQLMKEIKPDYCTLSIFTPYPGTEIFEELRREGVVQEEMNWARFSHASPYNYFAPQIPQERFAELMAWAAREVDRHNGNLWRLAKRAWGKLGIYLRQPKELLRDVRRYISWRKKGA